MSGRRDVWQQFGIEVIIPAARNPGYVLLGATRHVHRYLSVPGRKGGIEPVARHEHDGVYEALSLGLLDYGDPTRVQVYTPSGDKLGSEVAGREVRVTAKGARAVPEQLTITYRGQRHRIERREDASGPGTTMEHWPGRGYIGSSRRFNGHSYAKTLTWFATVNPTGTPSGAHHGVTGLASRRAALDWLFAHTTTLGN